MIETTILPFQALSLDALYDILALRSQVFIVEQNCVYQDLDCLDQEALHLQMREQGQLIAYARILSFDDNSLSFGRLVTAPSHRGKGLGKQLMDHILSYLKIHHPHQPVTIKAQSYLEDFYQSYGFVTQGAPFDMDGILHLLMVKQP